MIQMVSRQRNKPSVLNKVLIGLSISAITFVIFAAVIWILGKDINMPPITGSIVLLFGLTLLILFFYLSNKENNRLLVKERQLSAELKASKVELEKRMISEREQRILAVTLREMTLALTSKTTRESVIDEIVYQTPFMMLHKAVSVVLIENEIIEIAKTKGYKTPSNQLVSYYSEFYLQTQAIYEELKKIKKTLIIKDTKNHKLWKPINGDEWINSHISAPIIFQKKIIGILRLESDIPNRYSTDDALKLLPFTSATAIALENTRLLRDTRRQKKHLDTLHQISKEIMALTGLDELLYRIAKDAIKLLNAEAGGIYLYRKDEDVLEWMVSVGDRSAKIGTKLKRGEGVSGKVLETGKPIIIENYETWEGVKSPDWPLLPVSIICVPILRGDEFLGVLNIQAVRNPNYKFNEEDATLVAQYATLAAVAIDNAKLYQNAQQELIERRKAEQLLHESEEKYRRLIEQSNDAIYLLYDKKFEIINKQFTKMFGYTFDEINTPNFNFINLVAPESIPIIEERIRKTKIGEDVEPIYEFIAIRKDGRYIDCEVSASYVEYKDGKATQGIIRDISQRKQAEAQLARLASLVEQSNESIIITDLEGNIEYVNPAFEKTSGYTLIEVVGENPNILKSGRHDSDFYDNLWNTIRHGELWSGVMINKKKDNTLYYEDSVIFPIKNKSDEIINFAAVKKDITSERQLEEQLFQSQKLEAIGQLAGGIAHDFNNILTVINGYADLLLMKINNNNPLYNNISGIANAGKRAHGLVRQLLAFSRKQIMEAQNVDLNKLIVDLDKMMQRLIGEDIIIVRKLEENLPFISADPAQIEQILINLVVNARDAIIKNNLPTADRQITIETSLTIIDKESSVDKSAQYSGQFISINVSDTGVGMDKQTKDKIFEPFFTTKAKGEGTGLGLATVYGIVKQNKGMIFVYSEEGIGTTFKIYWPCLQSYEARKQVESSLQDIKRGTETILVAEDDLEVQNLICDALNSLGYKVVKASNGEEALKIFEENNRNFDLLITDVVMPKMSGAELVEIISKKEPNLKVLFTSGYTGEQMIRSGIKKREINFLAKPYSIDVLAKKIREIIES